MNKHLVSSVLLLGLSLPLAGTATAADVDAGRAKAFTCLGCHGVPGYNNVYPTYKVPKLGGQHAPYIVSALKAYQAGQRGHDTMHAQAASLSAQDMEDIAAFFASVGK